MPEVAWEGYGTGFEPEYHVRVRAASFLNSVQPDFVCSAVCLEPQLSTPCVLPTAIVPPIRVLLTTENRLLTKGTCTCRLCHMPQPGEPGPSLWRRGAWLLLLSSTEQSALLILA
jgi:hypothetical protein